MIVFYCDESGSYYKDGFAVVRKEQRERWYILGALAVPVRYRKLTHDVVLDLKNQYLLPLAPGGYLHERSQEAELKGKRLLARVRGSLCDLSIWNSLTVEGATDMLGILLSKLRCLHGSLFVVAIDQALLYRKMFRLARPAPFVALTFLQQRACGMLEVLDSSQGFGIFVLDRGSAVEREFEVDEFLETRDGISSTGGVRCAYDRFLLENPVVGKSSDLPQIQICDVLLYIIADAIRTGEPGGEWFKRAAPFVCAGRDRRILGTGITFFPPEAIPHDWREAWEPSFSPLADT